MRFKYSKKIIAAAAIAFLLFSPVGIAFSPSGTFIVEKNTAQAACGPDEVAILLPNADGTSFSEGCQKKGASIANRISSDDFGCGVSTLFTNCMAAMVYYIGPGLAQYPAYFGAYFFSVIVSLSLNSAAYALSFLSDGWETVRDLANMAFIFILIYLAITIMLRADTSGTIRTLASVVVIAMLVNFSFFFTRVAIDAGNILAVQFYNEIKAPANSAFGNGTKDLSASILQAVNFHSLIGSSMFEKAKVATGGSMSALIVTTVIYLSVAAMLWMLFFAFLQVGIKFLLRIVGLWFVLIASPLAFVAKTMSQTEKFFDKWLHYLINFSFYPAIFLFLYLIMTRAVTGILQGNGGGGLLDAVFASSSGLGNASTAAGATTNYTQVAAVIANVGVRMGFVIAMLYVALKAADWLVAEGTGAAQKATGWLTGKSLATIGFASRNSIGSAGSLIANNTRLANSKNVFASALWRGGRLASRSSFDARNVAVVNKGVDLITRQNIQKTGTGINMGVGGGQGGIAAKDREIDSKREAIQKERDTLKKERAATIRDAANKDAIKRIEEDAKQGRTSSQADIDRIKNLGKREQTALEAEQVIKIAHLLNEGQLKTEMDNENRTDEEKDKIKTIAEPIIKSQKVVAEELRKAAAALRTVSIPGVRAKTQRGADISLADIATMRREVDAQQIGLRTAIASNPRTDNTERQKDLDHLHNTLNSLGELEKQIRKIPAIGTLPAQVHKVT